METVRFITGYTTSSGGSPFELILQKVPIHILAEVELISIERLKGFREYGKIYQLLVTCEKGSPEETWFQDNPLFEVAENG